LANQANDESLACIVEVLKSADLQAIQHFLPLETGFV